MVAEKLKREIPQCSVIRTPLQGAPVLPLVGELRSCRPCGAPPKKKEKLTGVAYVGDKNCKYSYDWFTDQ